MIIIFSFVIIVLVYIILINYQNPMRRLLALTNLLAIKNIYFFMNLDVSSTTLKSAFIMNYKFAAILVF